MKLSHRFFNRRPLGLWVGLLLLGSLLRAADPADLPADEIIRRLIARGREVADLQPSRGLAYTRRTVIEELDDHSAVLERKTREHAVTNLAGVTRAVLVRLDDREPSTRESRADEKRENENQRDTSHRRGRRGGPDFLDEALVRRFVYESAGEEMVAGRRTLVLSFEPVPGAKDSGEVADRLLARLHGRMWIDAEEFELVKVESHLKSPLSVLGGLAASLTRIDLLIVRERLSPGVWTNRKLLTYAEGRKLLSSLRMRMQVDQEDFRELPVKPAAL